MSVIKKPIDCSNDAWQRLVNAAKNKNGQTLFDLYEIFKTLISLSFGAYCFKLKNIHT